MHRSAGRPKVDKKREPLSMKLDSDIFKEIEALALVQYATKSRIIEECLKLGIPAFIKREKAEEKLSHYKKSLDHYSTEKKRHSG